MIILTSHFYVLRFRLKQVVFSQCQKLLQLCFQFPIKQVVFRQAQYVFCILFNFVNHKDLINLSLFLYFVNKYFNLPQCKRQTLQEAEDQMFLFLVCTSVSTLSHKNLHGSAEEIVNMQAKLLKIFTYESIIDENIFAKRVIAYYQQLLLFTTMFSKVVY